MIDYRNILRLHSQGNSQREIERELCCSRHTISNVLIQAEAAGIAWPLDDDVTNENIQEILFPEKYKNASPYTMPDFQWIHKELAKKGVTLTLLWDEYCRKVRMNGGVPYMYTQFCEKYRRWARVTKATMRITHKPGDAMQVDWAGDPLYLTDPVTGELSPAYIFVAVLPCSLYTYAEACDDMKRENWLLCHVHAYNYFGGVTRLLIPDNCKTATTINNRYETILNKSYQEMAEHYGTVIVPTRVLKPDIPSATMEGIEYHEDRKLDKAQLVRFSTCKYIDEEHHIILKGATGNGKTYIACALGNAACRKFKSVRYVRMPELLDELTIARVENMFRKVTKAYSKVDLLILDEWLMRPLTLQQSFDLFEIVEDRTKHGSTIFCTQYDTTDWYDRINTDSTQDSPISDAIMDRIVHNAYVVSLEGTVSMRERHGLAGQQKAGEDK